MLSDLAKEFVEMARRGNRPTGSTSEKFAAEMVNDWLDQGGRFDEQSKAAFIAFIVEAQANYHAIRELLRTPLE